MDEFNAFVEDLVHVQTLNIMGVLRLGVRQRDCEFGLEIVKCWLSRYSSTNGKQLDICAKPAYEVHFEASLQQVGSSDFNVCSSRINIPSDEYNMDEVFKYFYGKDQVEYVESTGKEESEVSCDRVPLSCYFVSKGVEITGEKLPILCARVYCRLPYSQYDPSSMSISRATHRNYELPFSLSMLFDGGDQMDCQPNVTTVTDSENDIIEMKTPLVFVCKACGNTLTALNKSQYSHSDNDMDIHSIPDIQYARKMPSGIFDDMMHSFVCSEERNASLGLYTSDLIPSHNTLLSSPISVHVHPIHFSGIVDPSEADLTSSSSSSSSVIASCKNNNSVMDMIFNVNSSTNCGKGIAGKAGMKGCCVGNNSVNMLMVPTNDINDYIRMTRFLINIDTCRIYCKNCHNYIGDGVFDVNIGSTHALHTDIDTTKEQMLLNEVPIPIDHETTADGQNENNNEEIVLEDLCDIRLLGNKVNIVHPVKCTGTSIGTTCAEDTNSGNMHENSQLMSLEQMVSRLLYQLHSMTGMSNFYIFPEELYTQFPITDSNTVDNKDNNNMFNGIYIKLLSKDYKIMFPTTNMTENLSDDNIKKTKCMNVKSILHRALKIECQLHDIIVSKTTDKTLEGRRNVSKYVTTEKQFNSSIKMNNGNREAVVLKNEMLHIPMANRDIKEIASIMHQRHPLFNENGLIDGDKTQVQPFKDINVLFVD